MADISAELAAIKSAVYGEEVRGSIHDGLQKMNSDLNTAVGRQLLTVDSTLTKSGQGADAKIVGDKVGKRLALSYSDYIEIPSNSNLNSYAANAGNYSIATQESANTILNMPVKCPGRMFVFSNGSSDGAVQIYMTSKTLGKAQCYIRSHISDNWSKWACMSEGGRDNASSTMLPNIFTAPVSYSRLISTSMWTTGGRVDEYTGANRSDANGCRSSYIPYEKTTCLYISNSNYVFNCWCYSTASSSDAVFSPRMDYDNAPVLISNEGSSYFRIGVKRADGNSITTNDITEIISSIRTTVLTDSSLTLSNVPVDSATICDKALIFKGILPDASNLNNIIDHGIYLVARSYTYYNSPVPAGFLIVLRYQSMVTQTIFEHNTLLNSFKVYKRDGTGDSITSEWSGVQRRVFERRIAFFGDSIIWGRNGSSSGQVPEESRIHSIVANTLGVEADNYGVGSQGYVATSVPSAFATISSVNLSQYDAVVMCYGMNDGYHKLGTWDSTDESTVMGQFNKIVNYIYTQKPDIRLIVFAPFNGTNVGTYPDYWYGPRNNSEYASRKILSDTLKRACDYYWIPYIEQYDGPINVKNISTLLPDGVHPNETGYKMIGEWFAAKIGGLM